jgi:hypothetical protein
VLDEVLQPWMDGARHAQKDSSAYTTSLKQCDLLTAKSCGHWAVCQKQGNRMTVRVAKSDDDYLLIMSALVVELYLCAEGAYRICSAAIDDQLVATAQTAGLCRKPCRMNNNAYY